MKLVCGGASGHEPAHAGFVSDQMLHAAVCGRVSECPTVEQVRRALEHMIQDTNGREVLLLAKRSTGDAENFKVAADEI